MESCSVTSRFPHRNSLDRLASSGEAVAVRQHQWDGRNATPEFAALTRQTDTEGEGKTTNDPYSCYSHAFLPGHITVESNLGSCEAIKDSGWLKRGLTGGAATFSMLIVPRNLSNLAGSFIRLFYTRACALLGGFIQRCVRCLLTMAARRRWRKAAKKEEMAEGDVHSPSHNALSARGASGNRSVITFFYISFWAAKPTDSIGCLLCRLAVASNHFFPLFSRC